jgi:hypothetical protein
MAQRDGMTIQPAEVEELGRQFDDLAERLHRVLRTEEATLTVMPSGADEVSQRIALTLNEVRAAFGTSSQAGVDELRETAATVRAHANDIAAFDDALDA